METVSLEHQIQSVQRHIAFLKKQQLELLHDLHLEILRLQKHCTELTHDLEMRELEASQQDLLDQELEEKCKIMESQLQEKEKDNLALRKELRQKESLVAALRSNLRNKERKFLEELKRRSHRVTILNTELQKQTEAAAYLSFQLHATKQKFLSSKQGGKPLPDRPSEKGFLPPASGEVRPKKRTQKSHARRQVAGSFHGKGAFRDSSSRERLSGLDETDPMPDPALFLYAKRHHAPARRAKPEPKVSARGAPQMDADRGDARGCRPKSPRQASHDAAEPACSIRTLGETRPPSKGETCHRNGSSPRASKDSE
uniref:Coiled-coil domain-containing 92B n=1 Tax=Pogona vitticeps TaxID=103695 RepID=A0ABM5EMM6_9SAUR